MNNLRIFILFLMSIALVGCGFAEAGNNYDIPGFFSGIWHGLLALWSLILRLFLDIETYALPNSGWSYDLGFFIGIFGSVHIGWIAAIIALIFHIFIS
jgi:hypothetical protein